MNNPAWLKVVCITSIVLGSLGLLMAITGMVGALLAEQTQASTLRWMEAMQGPAAPPQIKDIQRDLMQQAMTLQRDWLAINLVMLAAGMVVAALLLIGGILALRKKPAGRKWLLAALTVAAAFELVRVVPTAAMQWQMSKMMGPFMERILDTATPPNAAMPPAQRRAMQTVMRSSMVAGVLLGLLTALGMAVVKISFYLWGIWLLRRPHFAAMFVR